MRGPEDFSTVTSFGDELLAALTVHAQAAITQVHSTGLGRPRKLPQAVDGRTVPTGGTVALLILAGLNDVPVSRLAGLLSNPDVGRRRDSLRVLVNRALAGDVRSFKTAWLDALARAAGLGADIMGPVRAAHGRPGDVNPDRLIRTVRRLVLAQRDSSTPAIAGNGRAAGGTTAQRRAGGTRSAAHGAGTATAEADIDTIMHTWLRAMTEGALAAPPWSPDAPADYPRQLDGELTTPLALVLGPSGAGKSRWLAARAAELAVAARESQAWHQHSAEAAALPFLTTASAVAAQLHRLEEQGDDPDPWRALIQAGTRPAVGRLLARDLALLRARLLHLMHAGQPVAILVDALDELPDRARRNFTGQAGPVTTWLGHPGAHLVLVAREAGQVPGHLLPGNSSPRQLRPVDQWQREEYWRRWKGSATDDLVRRARQDPVVRQLVSNPFLASLAAGSTTGTGMVTRSSLLRDALPRLVTADWSERPVNGSAGVPTRIAEEIAWRMATDPAGWSAQWPTERVRDLIRNLCGVREDSDGIPWRQREEYEASDAQTAALTVLLPGLAEGPHSCDADVAFAHAQLQEFLVARQLARQSTQDAVQFLRERWWHLRRWQDVTVLLAGILPDPRPLLQALDHDAESDPLGILDSLAVRSLAELPAARRPLLTALVRVRALLAGSPLHASSAQDLELLGADGFHTVTWETLAPWSSTEGSAGHDPGKGFTYALRVGAQPALDILERMADGETSFAHRGIKNTQEISEIIAMWGSPRERPLAAVADRLVRRLAVSPVASLDRGSYAYEAHFEAATEVWLRGLDPLPGSLAPDLITLLENGRVQAAVTALYEIARQPPPPNLRWNMNFALKSSAIPVDVLARVVSDSQAPPLLREAMGIELAKRAPAAARRRLPALLTVVENPLKVALALASAGDDSAQVMLILRAHAPRHTGAAKALLTLDPPAAIHAYRTLLDSTKEAEDTCNLNVMAAICTDLGEAAPELWLTSALSFTSCNHHAQPQEFKKRTFTHADRESLRRLAREAQGLRMAAIQRLDAVLDADVLREIARDDTDRRYQMQALRMLGEDPVVAEVATGLLQAHLDTCSKGWLSCLGMADVRSLLPSGLPDELDEAWSAHTANFAKLAADGDRQALDELRRRREQNALGADHDLLMALGALADHGSAEAAQELEERAVGSLTSGVRGSLGYPEWVCALAKRAPERAISVVRDALDETSRQGRPVLLWVLKLAADLGDEDAATRLIELRAAGNAVPSVALGGLRLDVNSVSVTPVPWIDGERARAVFAAHMGIIARRLGDTNDLDAFVASFRSSVITYGHLLNHDEAAALRGHLTLRSQALRTALATDTTSPP